MSYEVRIAHQAAAYYYRLLDRPTQRAINRRLSQAAAEPHSPSMKPIRNAAGRFTVLVGSWRLVFTVDDDAKRIEVSALRPRLGLFSRS